MVRCYNATFTIQSRPLLVDYSVAICYRTGITSLLGYVDFRIPDDVPRRVPSSFVPSFLLYSLPLRWCWSLCCLETTSLAHLPSLVIWCWPLCCLETTSGAHPSLLPKLWHGLRCYPVGLDALVPLHRRGPAQPHHVRLDGSEAPLEVLLDPVGPAGPDIDPVAEREDEVRVLVLVLQVHKIVITFKDLDILQSIGSGLEHMRMFVQDTLCTCQSRKLLLA